MHILHFSCTKVDVAVTRVEGKDRKIEAGIGTAF